MKPNDFPKKTILDGTEELYTQTSGVSEKFSLEQAKDYIRPYKVYTALLTQSGTDAPVATVLENTLSGEEIIWVRNDVGDYQANCSLLKDDDNYSDNKTFSNIFGYNTIQGADFPTSTTAFYSEQWFETGVIKLTTVTLNRDGTSTSQTFVDDALYLMPIEIRVYN